MRRLVVVILATVALLALSVSGAMAHPQFPPGEGDGVGGIPAAGPGHSGIQCAHEAGAPPFPVDLSAVFTCPRAG